MSRQWRVILLGFCVSALVVAAAGCGTSGTSTGTSNSPGAGQNGGGMMGGASSGTGGTMGGGASSGTGGMMGGASSPGASSIGERIFLTGVGSDGQKIQHSTTAVSQGSLMMGGGGCGSCHGRDGRGGTISMMAGAAVTVPDITYAALIKAGFTDTTIAAAIRDGLDESGKPLKSAMPRWQMSDADLNATIAYLKQLGGG